MTNWRSSHPHSHPQPLKRLDVELISSTRQSVLDGFLFIRIEPILEEEEKSSR
jgi:hypothetical protein